MTTSVLCDPKSQFMTPNLDLWFVLHRARGLYWMHFKDFKGGVSGAILFTLWQRTESIPEAPRPWLLFGCHQYSQ